MARSAPKRVVRCTWVDTSCGVPLVWEPPPPLYRPSGVSRPSDHGGGQARAGLEIAAAAQVVRLGGVAEAGGGGGRQGLQPLADDFGAGAIAGDNGYAVSAVRHETPILYPRLMKPTPAD